MTHYQQQFPTGPPRKTNLPLIIGAIVAVVVVGVTAVLAITLSGDNDDNNAGNADSDTLGTSTSVAPPNSITYEITGTSESPLDVVYTGSDGNDIEETVTSLPWSVTVDPAPDFVSMFALPTSIEAPNPDITLTLKRGSEVLRECEGGGPCLRPYPSS